MGCSNSQGFTVTLTQTCIKTSRKQQGSSAQPAPSVPHPSCQRSHRSLFEAINQSDKPLLAAPPNLGIKLRFRGKQEVTASLANANEIGSCFQSWLVQVQSEDQHWPSSGQRGFCGSRSVVFSDSWQPAKMWGNKCDWSTRLASIENQDHSWFCSYS